MKMRSLKTMALWFAVATMASTASLFAGHSHKHHSHSCSHPIPICQLTAQQIKQFELPALADANGVISNQGDIFIAQAFTRLSGGNPNPLVNPILAAFIGAQLGSNPGGAAQLGQSLANTLLALGVNPTAVNTFLAQQAVVIQASIVYSTAVATGGDSVAAYNAWQAATAVLAQDTIALGNFNPIQQAQIASLLSQATTNEAQAVQAYNLVLSPGGTPSTEFALAVQHDQLAHQNISDLVTLVIEGLICPQVF